jgi:hypothetical protein
MKSGREKSHQVSNRKYLVIDKGDRNFARPAIRGVDLSLGQAICLMARLNGVEAREDMPDFRPMRYQLHSRGGDKVVSK